MKWGVALLLTLPLVAQAIDPDRFEDPEMEARYRQLITELRCLVCQNQTLADSNAPLAVDLREQVKLRIEQGASDREIVDYLTERYGDFVLYRPPFNAVTAVLWLTPALLLLLGGFAAWRVARSRPEPGAGIDEAHRRRVRTLLDEEDR